MAQPAKVVDNRIHLSRLAEMRGAGGTVLTRGLDDNVIERFLATDAALATAIERAHVLYTELRATRPDLVDLDEAQQMQRLQDGIVNFYAADAVNPYVAAAAQGPWIVSLKGAVIYDCGGYGMLGLGHAPQPVLDAMNQPHVMANVMTSSISQMKFIEKLRAEIGHTRKDGTPFSHFMCLNSGSEDSGLAPRGHQCQEPDGPWRTL